MIILKNFILYYDTVKFTSYRMNLMLGCVSSLAACFYKLKWLPDRATTPIMLSYFIVDTTFTFCNDFIWKTPMDRKATDRTIEYVHHIMCLLCVLYR